MSIKVLLITGRAFPLIETLFPVDFPTIWHVLFSVLSRLYGKQYPPGHVSDISIEASIGSYHQPQCLHQLYNSRHQKQDTDMLPEALVPALHGPLESCPARYSLFLEVQSPRSQSQCIQEISCWHGQIAPTRLQSICLCIVSMSPQTMVASHLQRWITADLAAL